jgi:predicted dienelactone hydrolase
VSRERRRPDLQPIADPRVKAAVVMAPALDYLFDAPGLAPVRAPIRIYQAGADELLPEPWHAERLRRLLPTAPEFEVVPGAGHFVFLAPCSEAFARMVPPACTDPPGVDRVAVHARLNAEIVDFFRRTLR